MFPNDGRLRGVTALTHAVSSLRQSTIVEWISKLLNSGTLLIVNALLAALSSAFFLALYVAHPQAKRLTGVLLWTLGYAAFAAGFGVLILPAFHVSIPQLGLVGNLAIDVGAVLTLLAVNSYLRLPKGKLLVLVPVALILLAEIYIVLSRGENLRQMVILGGLLTSLLTTMTGVAFWQCQDEAQRPVARMAGVFHFLWAGVLLSRAAWWYAHPNVSPIHDPTATFGLLSRMVLTWILTPSVLWMLTRQLDAELIRYASQDSLTGIANRRVIWERGLHQFAELKRANVPLAVMMIDVDHFKSINDRWGHDVGDRMLVSVTQLLKSNIRGDDLLARVGGEEFMVLLRDVDERVVGEAAERLRKAIDNEYVPLSSRESCHCTISIGYCVATPLEASWKDVVIAADRALYAAKRAGRNRIVSAATLAPEPALSDPA